MTMAVKYQVSLVKRPQDLILVTLNHLDVLRSYVAGSATVGQQVEAAYRLLRQVGRQLAKYLDDNLLEYLCTLKDCFVYESYNMFKIRNHQV